MIDINISSSDNLVYIDVSGRISHNETLGFLKKYKQLIKTFKPNKYSLVVTPSTFECENNNDIKTVCMSFFKTGYKKIYLIDPRDYIMSNLSLGNIEKKLFLRTIKIVNSINEIK